jgi:hypothetical protein
MYRMTSDILQNYTESVEEHRLFSTSPDMNKAKMGKFITTAAD